VTSHTKADWQDELKVTFYKTVEDNDQNEQIIDAFKKGTYKWTGQLYVASYDSDENDLVEMSGTTVKYGVAKEGTTEGSDQWEKNKEK